MYAIIKTGGKQYRVSEGDVLNIEKLDVEAGSEVVFDEVLSRLSNVVEFCGRTPFFRFRMTADNKKGV